MLTPLEIENRRFRKEVFGYNQVEVEDFLSEVSVIYEKVFKDNAAASARINMLNDAIKQYKSMEETLQNAMTVAQKSGEEIRAEAREAADRIIANAQDEAVNIVADARRKAMDASYKMEEIKKSAELFKRRTIELLTAQLDIVKQHSNVGEEIEALAEFTDLDSPASENVETPSIAKTNVIDLTKILSEVGKISESIDKFATQEILIPSEGEEDLLSQTEEDESEEIKGLKEFFDEED